MNLVKALKTKKVLENKRSCFFNIVQQPENSLEPSRYIFYFSSRSDRLDDQMNDADYIYIYHHFSEEEEECTWGTPGMLEGQERMILKQYYQTFVEDGFIYCPTLLFGSDILFQL